MTNQFRGKIELTGKRRFRTDGCYKDMDEILILQVEYTEFVTTSENKPGRWVCLWRDATLEDVTSGPPSVRVTEEVV